ncbi:MAG: Do family serine endopeptidase [Chitinophagaceae bacterium]|nr:MAG: Do family serine endopeptidase [Chitinophagaceae bacterium]
MKTNQILTTIFLAFVVSAATFYAGFKIFEPQQEIIRISENQIPGSFTSFDEIADFGESQPVDFRHAAALSTPAVVHIRTTSSGTRGQQQNSLRDFFKDDFFSPRGEPRQRRSSGSGVIISKDGYIVTNNHVISNADGINVTLNDNRVYEAEVIGTDPSTDIALIRIKDANDLPFMTFGNSDAIVIGEWVLAVGNPFNLSSTVTAGIVSAKSRNINILREQTAIESFIQTDAAVNPGNSGGALVNLKGDLIGINTAIATPTGTFAGYSFAVPANLVNKIVTDLKEFGLVQRGFLGVTIRNVDADLAKKLDLPDIKGVYIESVGNSSAAHLAGIKVGDVITHVSGTPVNTSPQLQEQVARFRPGDEITIDYIRDGRNRITNVTLQNINNRPELLSRSNVDIMEKIGAELVELSVAERRRLNIDGGLKIEKLRNGILRSNTNIREGFVITHINKRAVRSLSDLSEVLEGISGGVLVEGIYPNQSGTVYYAFGM